MESDSAVREHINELERLIHEDPGNRGLAGIWTDISLQNPEILLKSLFDSASTLSSCCSNALVVRKASSSSGYVVLGRFQAWFSLFMILMPIIVINAVHWVCDSLSPKARDRWTSWSHCDVCCTCSHS